MDWDRLIDYLTNGDAKVFMQTLICLPICTFCSLIIGWVYRYTHKSVSYSQSYVQTLVLTSLVVALVMLVIGTNIARAFTLVGALSIIRFRNAIKETRDVGYIFFSMAVAMACGTQFYGVALIGTFFISFVMILLHTLRYGVSQVEPESVMRIRLPESISFEKTILPQLQTLISSYHLILTESAPQDKSVDMMLSVIPNKNVTPNKIVSELTQIDQGIQVTYNYDLNTEDL